MPDGSRFVIPPGSAGLTLAAALKQFAGPLSWSEARRLVASRRVEINGTPCVDDARRMRAGEVVALGAGPGRAAPGAGEVRVVYADADLIVVEKPAGIQTLRRPEERYWDAARRRRQPTLDELLEERAARIPAGRAPAGGTRMVAGRVRAVHRLDRDTSGLMLFALSPAAEAALVRQFAAHDVRRVYWALAQGRVEARTIETRLVRDRGDGLRGSSAGGRGERPTRAVTHVRPIEHLSHAGRAYTLAECRLETGRTHQIRIHLAEIGHPLCGEKVYLRPAPGAAAVDDHSGASRQALHSAELEFVHPTRGKLMRFTSPAPEDFRRLLRRLGAARPTPFPTDQKEF